MANTTALKKKKIKMLPEDKIMYTIVYTIVILLCIIILYPIIFIISSSFSSGTAVTGGRVVFLPVEFTTVGYDFVLNYKPVWTGYANTLVYTVVGTIYQLFMTTLAAYPLSRRNFQGRAFCMTLFTITMFFGGGMIPHFLLNKSLGLYDNRLVMILPGALTVHNMIIMRTFFRNSIPGELQEAAMLDGCSDIRYLIQIVIPLSKAVFSVLMLYYAVGHWNAYMSAMIYLHDEAKYPLQLILRTILYTTSGTDMSMSEGTASAAAENAKTAGESMQYALIVVATLPIMVLYPFVQKYFEKGVMIGSVKG